VVGRGVRRGVAKDDSFDLVEKRSERKKEKA
jgi:hypothetical protein